MSEIKVRCPKCGKVLRLADNPNIDNAVFTCPVCHEKHRVGECQKIVDAPKTNIACEETQYGFASSSGGEETQIVGSVPKTNVGVLVDGYGSKYQLGIGLNTIGRKASTSDASVQICVDDRYMSRNHAIIEVKNVGGKTLHFFRNGANKNPSYVNGVLVGESDKIILNNNDRIKLGMTEVIFKM